MKESPKPIDTPFSGFHQNSAYFSLFQCLCLKGKIKFKVSKGGDRLKLNIDRLCDNFQFGIAEFPKQ